MAATAAITMAHQMPPMSIPQMPRIRPPRMLKGTKSPNTDPQPPLGPSGEDRWWVQGKWRKHNANALKDRAQIQSRQAVKALRHGTHGLDIYAYRHVRTNQVVYSLTRTLQSTKVLNQLVFHGKKTVPSSVRTDMWTPHFSIHFPSTPAGALEGLFAFQKLRELSLQRQLSPPDDLIRVTEEDIAVIKSKIGNPVDHQEMAAREELTGKIPKIGEILPKKLHARRLMDHKATSVADAAFVLDWISSGPGPLERLVEVATNRAVRHSQKTRRARQRANTIRKEETSEQQKLEDRASWALEVHESDNRSRLPLMRAALEQLSMEHQGLVSCGRLVEAENIRELRDAVKEWEAFYDGDASKVDVEAWSRRQYTLRQAERRAIEEWFDLHDVPMSEHGSVWKNVAEARQAALNQFEEKEGKILQDSDKGKPDWAELREVKMYWADLNDGLFAASWPQNVVHSRLAPFNVARGQPRRPQGAAGAVLKQLKDAKKTDQAETEQTRQDTILSKSVHVIGGRLDDGWMPVEFASGVKQPAPLQPRQPDAEDLEDSYAYEQDQERGRGTAGEDIAAVREDVEHSNTGILARGWGRVRGFFGRRKRESTIYEDR
ncbi:transcriptional regulation of mitochondrial recombination-domain-containing protein [Exophiala viscosa]|uniref:Large ribosomal subunit protein mL67 n=1 Tax=Exophiala viscosa TaxID=2486360 RepID=A0AAN6DRH9_9EURO|nr:transcriptional regulation of mitochondrial recombination-domain-containing protein [Exophiala viscosa]KAI1624906.1 transcriptional regulation of mitochondrial recombination-domain-containing protein [Exophiala viscosa]